VSSIYKDWQSHFSIANQWITLSGNSLDNHADLHQFIALYARHNDHKSNLTFDILSNGDHHYLILDGIHELWHAQDAREITAAFEIQLYTQVIQRIFPEFLSLHAGCVAMGDEAWMFAGHSGAGKSSITTTGLLNGCRYMTDEFSLLDKQGHIAPMPRPMQWDTLIHPAFSHEDMLNSGKFTRTFFTFPDHQGTEQTLQLWHPTQIEHRHLPLTRLVFPRFDADAPPAQLTPIRRSEVLMELPHHLHQGIRPSDRVKMLNRRLPADTQCFRLTFSDVHAAWDHITSVT